MSETASTASALAGRRAIIAVQGAAIGAALAQGLERQGAKVALLGALAESRAAVDDAIATAAQALGGVDLLVHASATAQATTPGSLDALTYDVWQAATQRSLLATLYCLQAAHRQQRERGGAVVVVGPSTALVGAPGLVPLMTVAEAQRTLVKSAARQWGQLGMRLNWVGISALQYAATLVEAHLPQTPELGPPPPALGRVPAVQTEVADVIAWLASDGARGITGASFNLDGGDWMVP